MIKLAENLFMDIFKRGEGKVMRELKCEYSSIFILDAEALLANYSYREIVNNIEQGFDFSKKSIVLYKLGERSLQVGEKCVYLKSETPDLNIHKITDEQGSAIETKLNFKPKNHFRLAELDEIKADKRIYF